MEPDKAVEAGFLRDELIANKKFVFERPLVIVGALFLADALSTVGLVEVVLAMMALYYNLWFSANRLRSNARILAYIQLVHEPRSEEPWVGWETALRLYRFFGEKPRPSREAVWKPGSESTQKDALRFYGGIFYLHTAVLAVFVFFLVFRLDLVGPLPTPLRGDFARIAVVGLVFVTLAAFLSKLRPASERLHIEQERERWLGVFEEYVRPVPGEQADNGLLSHEDAPA